MFEYTTHVFNDSCVRSLICLTCAQVKVDTGRIRSEIQFVSGRWLFELPPGSLHKNFSMQVFRQRYCQSGTPLAHRGSGSSDVVSADFSDWTLTLHPNCLDILRAMPAKSDRVCTSDIHLPV